MKKIFSESLKATVYAFVIGMVFTLIFNLKEVLYLFKVNLFIGIGAFFLGFCLLFLVMLIFFCTEISKKT